MSWYFDLISLHKHVNPGILESTIADQNINWDIANWAMIMSFSSKITVLKDLYKLYFVFTRL